jgi:hypothetical protein
MAIHWTLGCDANDPAALAEFWAGALRYVAEPGYDDPDGASIIDPDGVGPAIGFLRVPEGKSAKNRMHIDVRRRRAALGSGTQASSGPSGESSMPATRVRGDVRRAFIVMLDPEGNEFCVG